MEMKYELSMHKTKYLSYIFERFLDARKLFKIKMFTQIQFV
jgi:hypothetical protein